jgi:hypothetical protein
LDGVHADWKPSGAGVFYGVTRIAEAMANCTWCIPGRLLSAWC